MLEVLVVAFKEVSWVLGLILALAVGAASAAMWLQQGALKESGHDRDRLLRSLRLGGDLRRHYVFWVTRALNRLDRFLGDAGKAAQSLRVPFIRNRRPAPYWTGWSFDTCALLAVMYPIWGMVAIWACAGEAGEIGETLSLAAHAPLQVRVVVGVMVAVALFAFSQFVRSSGWRLVFWFLTGSAALVVSATTTAAGIGTFAGTGGMAAAAGVAFAIVVAASGTGIRTRTVAGTCTVVAAVAVAIGTAVSARVAGAAAGAIVVAGAILVAGAAVFGAAVFCLADRANERQRLGTFWLTFWPLGMAICYVALWVEASYDISSNAQIFLVMTSLVPLVNVPFDWASVGFTRALLRRGCDPGAPSPLWLGLFDFVIGLLLLVLLAAALVAALHAVDWLTMRVAGRELIDLPSRLYSLVQTPHDPGNWWIYLTLFSTLIPSALNLVIGMFSLVTVAFPLRRRWLLDIIPRLQPTGWDATRRKVLAVLGAQAFLGVFGAGLALWGVAAAMLYLGQYLLFGFLYEAVLLEWLLPT